MSDTNASLLQLSAELSNHHFNEGYAAAKSYFTDVEEVYAIQPLYDHELQHYGALIFTDLNALKMKYPDWKGHRILKLQVRRVDVLMFEYEGE